MASALHLLRVITGLTREEQCWQPRVLHWCLSSASCWGALLNALFLCLPAFLPPSFQVTHAPLSDDQGRDRFKIHVLSAVTKYSLNSASR